MASSRRRKKLRYRSESLGRVQDRDNYYLARFIGDQGLELIRVKDGVESPMDAVPTAHSEKRRPTGMITLRRYRAGELWKLCLEMEGD